MWWIVIPAKCASYKKGKRSELVMQSDWGNFPSVIRCKNLFSATINSQKTLKKWKADSWGPVRVGRTLVRQVNIHTSKGTVCLVFIKSSNISVEETSLYSFLNTKYAHETGNILFARFFFVVPVCMNVFRFLTPPLHHFSNGLSP